MRQRILSLLRRLGLIPYEPYRCRSCGHTVPLFGSRWDQARLAYDHWEANHDAPATPEGKKE